MTPTEIWLSAGIVGLASFIGWFIKWALAHLESDLAYSRKASQRGADVAEKAVKQVSDG